MIHDFTVFTWKVTGPSWPEGLLEVLSTGEYNGLFMKIPKGVPAPSLEPLHEVRGLLYLQIWGPMRDDTLSFGLPDLEELTLLTRCKRRIPIQVSASIISLGVDNRPGLEVLAGLPNLRDLAVWLFGGSTMEFLGENLERVKVEGKRQLLSLEGIERCTKLRDVEVLDARVDSLRPLRHLLELERLCLIGDYRIKEQPLLDLGDVAGLNRLRELRLTYGGAVKSLAPLLASPQLRVVRLRETSVQDGSLAPLAELAAKGVGCGSSAGRADVDG